MLPEREHSRWLAKHILPREGDVRAWLRRFQDIEADDVIQEAYVTIIKSNIETIDNPIKYFCVICRNIIYKKYRSMNLVNISDISEIRSDNLFSLSNSLDDVIDARFELRFLEEIVRKIPEKYRDVFVERKINGHSQKHCSEILGISVRSVEKRLVKAMVIVGNHYSQRENRSKATSMEWGRGSRQNPS